MKLVKMVRADGHSVDVHPEMVEDYRKGGYQEVEADAAKPVGKGRKGKAAD